MDLRSAFTASETSFNNLCIAVPDYFTTPIFPAKTAL